MIGTKEIRWMLKRLSVPERNVVIRLHEDVEGVCHQ
jgi:hypothetical protein